MGSIKNGLIKFLKNFDSFGETHTFLVNTEKTYNSPVSGFFCFLFLIYTVYYVIFTLCDYIQGNYTSKEYELKVLQNPILNSSDHKYFSIAFCIRDSKYQVDEFSNRNLNMNLYYSSANLTADKILQQSSSEVPLIDCEYLKNSITNSSTISEHQRQYWDMMSKFRIEGCRCVNFDKVNDNFVLSSDLDGIVKNYFSLNLSYILNSANSTNISKYIRENNPKMHIYFPEYSAEISSNEESLKIKMHTEEFEINPALTQVSDLTLGVLSFQDFYSYTQDNIFNSKNKIIFDSKSTHYLNTLKDNSLLNLSFILGGKLTTYKRNFLKVQDYLGNIVGYLWNIILLVYCISWCYNNFGSKRFLSEKFFFRNNDIKRQIKKEFGKYSNLKSKKRGRRHSNKGKKNISETKKDNVIEIEMNNQENLQPKLQENEINENKNSNEMNNLELDSLGPDLDGVSKVVSDHDKKNDINSDSNSNLNMSDKKDIDSGLILNQSKFIKNNFTIYFFQYIYQSILSIFCCSSNSKTSLLYKSTENLYNYYMDISIYLKMMIEFEIIKSIVLSPNNRSLLRKFRPFLKQRYSYVYEDKLKDFYSETITKSDLDKLKKTIGNLTKENNIPTLKVLSKFV